MIVSNSSSKIVCTRSSSSSKQKIDEKYQKYLNRPKTYSKFSLVSELQINFHPNLHIRYTKNAVRFLASTSNVTNALCNKGWHFWKGGFVTDKTGLKIFIFINAMIFAFTTFVTNTPLYGKIASKVWKIYFQYISPDFLDAAGSQISDLWLLLLSNSFLFSALMSHLPLLLLHSALMSVNLNH